MIQPFILTRNPIAGFVLGLLMTVSLLLPGNAFATDFTWNGTGSNWAPPASWTPAGTPNSTTDVAIFGAQDGASFGVLLSGGPFTVNQLRINNEVSGGFDFQIGTLIFDGAAPVFRVEASDAFFVSFGVPTVASNATLQLNQTTTFNTVFSDSWLTIAGTITGAGGLIKDGPGTLVLSGTNSYAGGTTIHGGVLAISNDNNLGAAAGGVTFNGSSPNDSVLRTLAGITSSRTMTFTGNGIFDSNGFNSTWNGQLTGPGALIKTGAGTLTLTNNTNNYALATGFGGGTLAVSADAQLGTGFMQFDGGTLEALASFSSAKTVDLIAFGANPGGAGTGNGTMQVDPTFTLTLTGFVGGPGSLTKTGTGALTLTNNANDYSGGTFLNAGTIFADANNALGTSTLTIQNGTTLGSHVGGTTLANNVVVNGNFSITPASGGMTLSGNVNLGAATRTITNTTVQNSSFTAFFSGVISGTGGLTLEAPNIGYFEFTGANANTYGGVTTVQNLAVLNLHKTAGVNAVPGDVVIGGSGLVQLFAANQIPDTATVTDNGEFNLSASPETIGTLNGSGRVFLSSTGILTVGAGNFSGVMQDNLTPGKLVKNTAGTLILTGNSTYTGGTTINNGVLAIGSLHGMGLGNVLVNGGTLQTFNGPRTIAVGANYTQNGGGTLRLQIGGTNAGLNSDLLSVTGSASLGGTLALVRINNFNPANGARVNIITDAGGHSGTFATVTSNFSGLLQPVVHYDEALDVYLLFQGNSFSGLTGLTPNQKSVAHNLDVAANDPAAVALTSFLGNEPLGNLPHDYDLIAPEELASIYEIGFSQAVVQNNNLQRRMDDIRAGSNGFCANNFVAHTSGKEDVSKGADGKVVLPAKEGPEVYIPTENNRWGVFINGSGDFVKVDDHDLNAPGYDIATGDITVGADYRLCDHFAIGIDAGYSRSTADLVDDGRVDVDGGKIGAYATVFGKGLFGSKFYVDGGVGGGLNNYDTRRTGLQDELVRGNTDGTEFNAFIAYGSDWTFGCFNIGTWSTVQYTNVSIDEFTETGSLAPLVIEDQDENSFRATTGVHASYDIKTGHAIFRPEVRVAYQHEYCDSAYQIDSQLASGAGNVFRVRGPRIGRDAALVGAGMNMQWNNRLSTYVYYDGVLGRNNYDNNAVSGGFRIGF